MKTLRFTFLILVSLSLAFRLCGEATQAQAPAALSPIETKFEQAIDRLFAENFPQKLETYFCTLGSNPDLGFRLAGSEAEHATSERVAAEMRAMGLKSFRLEPVPVDAYEVKHASVTVGERTMVASTLDGTRPAPTGGIAAPLVYVKSGTVADYKAVGDVTGKLVLVDKRMSSWWFTAPGLEAARRGAVGVICTAIPEDPLFYSINDQALGGFANYDPEALPWVYVARRDGRPCGEANL